MRIVGEQFVSGIVVKNGSGTESTLAVEGVFMLLTGTAPVTDFIGGAVKTHAEGCIDVDCHAATNVPGVYAVGDVTCMHPNQAIIAAAEGAIAALSIDKFLSGRERTKVDYIRVRRSMRQLCPKASNIVASAQSGCCHRSVSVDKPNKMPLPWRLAR